ncbi:hypothetical protein H8959_014082 [Pygathrix nigripes]
METHLIPDTMMEEGRRETLPKEWVESIICMAPVLLRWLVDEEGDLSVSGWETCLILGYRIKMAVCLTEMRPQISDQSPSILSYCSLHKPVAQADEELHSARGNSERPD